MSDAIKAVEPAGAPNGASRFGVSDGYEAVANATAAPQQNSSAGAVDVATLQDAFGEVSQRLAASNVDVTYRVDGDLNRVIVEIVDRKDGTVLRQIPSEEALRLAREMKDGSGGLMHASA